MCVIIQTNSLPVVSVKNFIQDVNWKRCIFFELGMIFAALSLFVIGVAGLATGLVLVFTAKSNLYLETVVYSVGLVPLLTIWVIAHYVAWELFKHN